LPTLTCSSHHRRRSGWTSGGHMASAEGGSVPSGVEYGEGCPLSSQLRGLGEHLELPSGVRGRAPAENGFWRILKTTECSFLHLYDKIWGGGQFALAFLRSKFWGGGLVPLSPPRDLRPCFSLPPSSRSTLSPINRHCRRAEICRPMCSSKCSSI